REVRHRVVRDLTPRQPRTRCALLLALLALRATRLGLIRRGRATGLIVQRRRHRRVSAVATQLALQLGNLGLQLSHQLSSWPGPEPTPATGLASWHPATSQHHYLLWTTRCVDDTPI